MTNETNYDSIFGRIAVEQGLCTSAELRHSLEELQARRKINNISLINLMIDLGYVTANQAERLKKNLKESKAVAHQIPGYKILGKIGAGAMAVVYKAQQLSLNRTVAIKVLPKRFSENQEYVEGKSIYDDLAAGKVFSEAEALDVIIQVAHALEHAHACGLIHRDVKPKNIMINNEGVVKLADMGLARETTDIEAAQTEAGRAYGTPYYIAPEQIRGEIDIDGRADIYGLGSTFYHMVTGRVPFMADDPVDVMKKHLREQLIPPDHINTSLSAGASEVIEVMMAKRKQDRYNNVKELLIDLEAVRSEQAPIRARRRFDVSAFQQLERGRTVQPQQSIYMEQNVTRYRIALLILGSALVVSFLLLIVLLFK